MNRRPRTVKEMERNIAAIMERRLAGARAAALVELDRRCKLLQRVVQRVQQQGGGE